MPVPVLSLYNVLVETPRLDRLVPLLPAPIKWGLIICIEKIKECMHSFWFTKIYLHIIYVLRKIQVIKKVDENYLYFKSVYHKKNVCFTLRILLHVGDIGVGGP